MLLKILPKSDISDKNNLKPLFYAVSNSNMKAVELLVQHNARINHKNSTGWSSLHEAVNNESYGKLFKHFLNND